ncbi:MAG: IS607 family transposase [Chloroflexota bacterium]
MFRLGKAATLLGVRPETIRQWERAGKIRVVWITGRQPERRVPLSEVLRLKHDTLPGLTVLYARVSGTGQKDDLARQGQRLRLARPHPEVQLISDIGSGLNSRRHGLSQLMALVEAGQVREVVIEHRERLSRLGVEYLEAFFRAHQVRLTVLEEDAVLAGQAEMVQDFIDLIASFSGRLYGRRSAAHRSLMQSVQAHIGAHA